jgi:proliferating cell nuclear antigen
MLDIDEVRLEIPDTNFDSVLTMPSVDFQRICRDMAVLSDSMQLHSESRKLVLSAIGDFAEQTTEIGEREHGMYFTNYDKDNASVYYGKFNLKFLTQFAKASVMCGTVDLYLKPEYPLILSYSVASLGRLLFVLATDITPS